MFTMLLPFQSPYIITWPILRGIYSPLGTSMLAFPCYMLKTSASIVLNISLSGTNLLKNKQILAFK